MLSLALAGCSRRNADPPAVIDGTWSFARNMPGGGQFQSTTAVARDGHYVCQISIVSSNHSSKEGVEFQGTFEVKDGFLIDTINKDSQTNGRVPRTSRARIIRMNDREMVVKYEESDTEAVFRRQNSAQPSGLSQ
jgi:hypothetical protein